MWEAEQAAVSEEQEYALLLAEVAAGTRARRSDATEGAVVQRDDRSGFTASGPLSSLIGTLAARFPGSVRSN
jgi:hypothetical protein